MKLFWCLICSLVVLSRSATVVQHGCAQQVYLSLGATIITVNNTEIRLCEIGEDALGGLPSLVCHTDLPNCCRDIDTFDRMAAGQWLYPNGSVVQRNNKSTSEGENFYRVRNAPQVVTLARRQAHNPLRPTGSYCCVIPSTRGEVTFCAILIVCPSLPPLTNGNILYTHKEPPLGIDSVATYTCDPGYTLTISETTPNRTCQGNCKWSKHKGFCAAPCLDLPYENITYSNNARPWKTKATLKCDSITTSWVCEFRKYCSAWSHWFKNDSVYRQFQLRWCGTKGVPSCAVQKLSTTVHPLTTTVDLTTFVTTTSAVCLSTPYAISMTLTTSALITVSNALLASSVIAPSSSTPTAFTSSGHTFSTQCEPNVITALNMQSNPPSTPWTSALSTSTKATPSISSMSTPSPATSESSQFTLTPSMTRLSSSIPPSASATFTHPTTSGIDRADGTDGGLVAGIVIMIVSLLVVIVVLVAVFLVARYCKCGKLHAFSFGEAKTKRLFSTSDDLLIKPAITLASSETISVGESIKEEKEDGSLEDNQQFPFNISNFPAHVERMHEDSGQLFAEEYNSISKAIIAPFEQSRFPYNKEKNRFKNIYPYDLNRVKLKGLTKGSDYINASYINGHMTNVQYIAAQGPLPNTLEDFWRMIWEHRSPTIVMLTNCYENGSSKCECYWPQKHQPLHFECGLVVTLTTVTVYDNFSVRRMSVTEHEPSISYSQPLEVTQFHYTSWPDHGVPSSGMSLVYFTRTVRRAHPQNEPRPLLVHCSAGVGRTGTFITLDTMLDRMEQDGMIHIYDCVTHIRKQRVLLVQTLSQYIFLHDTLKELIMCGETEIQAYC